MKSIFKILVILILFSSGIVAQQDPQYTQYMYNTMVLNPAYTGTKGYTTITALARTQWVGFTGAPDSQNLSYQTQLKHSRVGLGANIVNDKIGHTQETYLDGNVSYSLQSSEKSYIAFGLKLGGRLLSINPSKGTIKDVDDSELPEINNKFLPTVGAGIYYYANKIYLGASVPNLIKTEHYDKRLNGGNVGVERFHTFLTAGYVFDITRKLKFKPATIVKLVSGAPYSFDVSANFMFNNKFRSGLAWRWDDSISGLLGFQVSDRIFVGYAYDLTTSNYSNTNSGTHELLLQFSFYKKGKIASPRFF